MVIAIDDAGDFARNSKLLNFFVAVHLRTSESIYDKIKRKFDKWENNLDPLSKNKKGEIKGRALPDRDLFNVTRRLFRHQTTIGITAVGFSSVINPVQTFQRYKDWQVAEVAQASVRYSKLKKQGMAREYKKYAEWISSLNYEQFAKVITLSQCIYNALQYSITFAAVNKFDAELVDIQFKIDEEFMGTKRHKEWWLGFLRDDHFNISKTKPLVPIDSWDQGSHPFLKKYWRNGKYDLTELIHNNVAFLSSTNNFDIRLADHIATVFHRHYNNKTRCSAAHKIVTRCYWSPSNSPLYIYKYQDINGL